VKKNIVYPSGLTDIDAKNVARVDELNIEISGYDFFAKSYLLHPVNRQNVDRLVILHQGHVNDLGIGVGETANHLLQHGFTVALLHMPLLGWNTDNDGTIPCGPHFEFSHRSTDGHNEIFAKLADKLNGATFRLFLEPVIQCINYFLATNPNAKDVSMIGMSGGGWATTMAAAVDKRIRLSVPVAGTAPLYHRNSVSRSGDAEQHYLPLYNEDIAPDGSGGGIATWLEIYVLGGYGKNRCQVMVTNEFESGCFRGRFAESFKMIVANVVENLGQGEWKHILDSTHKEHIISTFTIKKVVSPLLEISEPTQ
jgi:hypothetical protein